MSLINRTTQRIKGGGALHAEKAAQRLSAAQADLTSLEAQYPDTAFDASLDVEGAKAKLAKLEAQIANAKAEIATSQAALAGAQKRDAETIRAQRADIRRTQLAAVKANLIKRDEAAADLSAALSSAVKAWKALIGHSDKANAATPLGDVWPSGGVYSRNDLRRLVAAELYRLDGGNALVGGAYAFPGAEAEFDYIGRPDAIPPLTKALADNSAYVLAEFDSKGAK